MLRASGLCLLLFAAQGASAAGPPTLATTPGLPVPDWLREEMAFRVEGSGRFVADNARYTSAQEPAEQYAVEWRWGIGRTSITGRLWAVRGGAEQTTFWEYRLYWDPSAGKAFLDQWGLGAAFGHGEVVSTGPGRTETVQVFRSPGRPEWASRHLSTLVGDEDRSASEELVAGAWKPGRTYTWKRVP